MFDILKNRIIKGVVTRLKGMDSSLRAYDPLGSETAHSGSQNDDIVGFELKALIHKRFGRSLHIRYIDTGSCGACESEVIAANNPIYDLQRFGVNFVASPRHADALLVIGPVTKNMAVALRKTYDAMPEPKFVITAGDCAFDGGIFKDSYYTEGAAKNLLSVALHIKGCPPSPSDIINSLVKFLSG